MKSYKFKSAQLNIEPCHDEDGISVTYSLINKSYLIKTNFILLNKEIDEKYEIVSGLKQRIKEFIGASK